MEKKNKKTPKKVRADVKHMKTNLTVENQDDEALKSQSQDPPPPASAALLENLINPEELKKEPIEFDLSTMNFLKVHWTKEDELANSLRPRKSKSGKRTKHMPENIKKKSGNQKRFDLVGPVQVKSPTREVVIPHVLEIVKVPESTYADAFHISEQPPIELYLDELVSVKALTKTKRYPERLEFHYSSGSRIPWPL